MRRRTAGNARHRGLDGASSASIEVLEPRLHFAAGTGLMKFLDASLVALAAEPMSAESIAVTVRSSHVKAATAALAKMGFEVAASRPDLRFVEGTFPVASLSRVTTIPKNVG